MAEDGLSINLRPCLAVWGGALYGQVTGKLMVDEPGWLMLADQGRMMMAKAERAAKVDCDQGQASGRVDGDQVLWQG